MAVGDLDGLLLRHLFPMDMTVFLVVVDTQEILAIRECTFSAVSRHF